jgi:hypothetical protein
MQKNHEMPAASTTRHGNVGFAASPSTVNNDDSCDVTVGPAATLLLR